MDIVSIFSAFLILVFLIFLLVLVSHATLVSLIIGVVAIIATVVIMFFILKYSKKIIPAPVVDRIESPIPMIGGLCEVLDDITPTEPGYVRYRGELWKAFSVTSSFKKGDYAYVVDVRGKFLIIEREPKVRAE